MAPPEQSRLTMTTQLSLFDDLTIQHPPTRARAPAKGALDKEPQIAERATPRPPLHREQGAKAAAGEMAQAFRPTEPSAAPTSEPKAKKVVPSAGPSGPPTNLAEAVAMLGEDVCSHKRRGNYRSDMRVFAKAAGKPLDQIPTDPQELRLIMAGVMPAKMGWSAHRWKAVRSGVVSGLRVLKDGPETDREAEGIAAEWQALLDRLPDPWHGVGLSKLLRYLSQRSITPALFTTAVFDDFKAEQLGKSLKDNPSASIRAAAKNWNSAARQLPDWPQIRLESVTNARRWSYEWEEFPKAFRDDVEAFLEAKETASPFRSDYSKPVSKATTKNRRIWLRVIASALVKSGRLPIQRVTGLQVLVKPENATAALEYLVERAGGEIKESLQNHLWLLRTIAAHWVRDPEAAALLKGYIANTKGASGQSQKGMKEKNRQRLEQFHHPGKLAELYDLPAKILAEVEAEAERKGTVSYRMAVRVMRALQIAILSFAPIRIGNLADLRLGENLIDQGMGKTRQLRIDIPWHEVKNKQPYRMPLSLTLLPLFDAWMKKYRPVISSVSSAYVFPSPRGKLRSKEGMSIQLSSFLKRETGLVMHMHFFRHLAASVVIRAHPNGYEIARQLLGHTSLRTTLKAYAELQTDPAFKRFEEAVLQVMATQPGRGRGGKRSGR